MTIAFTQYLRPDGRRENVGIDRSPEVEALAAELIARGVRFEVEHLMTGEASFEAVGRRGPHSGNMSKTIHIAGFPVRVGNDFRQRCAWCGAMLINYDLTRIAVATNADGTPEEVRPGSFELGATVAVDGPGKWIEPHEDGAQLPKEFCGNQLPPVAVFAGTRGSA